MKKIPLNHSDLVLKSIEHTMIPLSEVQETHDLPFPAYGKTKALVRFFKEGKGLALAYVNDKWPASLKKRALQTKMKTFPTVTALAELFL